jgi:alkaline phosphatase
VTPNGNAVNNCPASGNGRACPPCWSWRRPRKATGAVTTARLTHATPAATYSHICHRDAEYHISRQAVPGGAGYNSALGEGVDVLLGGGSFWRPSTPTTPKGRPTGATCWPRCRPRATPS